MYASRNGSKDLRYPWSSCLPYLFIHLSNIQTTDVLDIDFKRYQCSGRVLWSQCDLRPLHLIYGRRCRRRGGKPSNMLDLPRSRQARNTWQHPWSHLFTGMDSMDHPIFCPAVSCIPGKLYIVVHYSLALEFGVCKHCLPVVVLVCSKNTLWFCGVAVRDLSRRWQAGAFGSSLPLPR